MISLPSFKKLGSDSGTAVQPDEQEVVGWIPADFMPFFSFCLLNKMRLNYYQQYGFFK